MTEKRGYRLEAHPSVDGLGGQRVAQAVRADMADPGGPRGLCRLFRFQWGRVRESLGAWTVTGQATPPA